VLPGAMILGREWKEKKQSKRLAKLGDVPYESTETTRRRSKVHSMVRGRLSRPWPTIIVFTFIAGGLASGQEQLPEDVSHKVSFEMSYHYRSPAGRFTRGIAKDDLLLRWSKNRWLIDSFEEKVDSR
jgi:hypothetical protein